MPQALVKLGPVLVMAAAILAAGAGPGLIAQAPAPGAVPGGRVAPAALAPGAAAPAAAPETPKTEPKLITTQWLSLYLAGKKIGYHTQNLYALPGGLRRLVTNEFLRQSPGAEKFGYFKTITADVDAKFRPQALDCRVTAGDRSWQVKGQVEGRELVLKRTTPAGEASAKVPLDEDVTFRSWALPATFLGGARSGEMRRWLVVDESIGALLPTQCLVQMVGARGGPVGPNGVPVAANAFVVALGPEQVAHLVDSGGRIVRSLWQSAPMVAEATSLSEARRLTGAADGPRGVEIEELKADHYRNTRLGLSLWVPAYPCVAYVAPQSGAVEVADLMDEASVSVQPLPGVPATAAALPATEVTRQADLIQRQWAARFEDVKGQSLPHVESPAASGTVSRSVEGTARLGCTTYYFRNTLLMGGGLPWFVSVTVADRPLSDKPTLAQSVAESVKVSAPEGRLPIQASGDTLRSAYYGFEIRRPSGRWGIPSHVDGPVTVLEMAREDQAAVAIIRVMTPRPGLGLEAFAAEQAEAVAENLQAAKPEPKATTLGGQKAVEITYAGPKILAGTPARCTAVYTWLDTRVFALTLIASASADESARKDAEQIRESVKFFRPGTSNPAEGPKSP